MQQDGGPLPSSLAATVAAALPERPPEATTKQQKKKKKKDDSRSFRSFLALCEDNAGKESVEPSLPPTVKFTVNMYNASKRETKTRVSANSKCGYMYT